mmetsp:Transcript_25832/g.36531  ORF Transcript_25832/g.36531 Transcript_25832/m.36531 type:complete len:689 (-) Transcript_25832:130-2196(-)
MLNRLSTELVLQTLLFLLDGRTNQPWLSCVTVNRALHFTLKKKQFLKCLAFWLTVPTNSLRSDISNHEPLKRFQSLHRALFSTPTSSVSDRPNEKKGKPATPSFVLKNCFVEINLVGNPVMTKKWLRRVAVVSSCCLHLELCNAALDASLTRVLVGCTHLKSLSLIGCQTGLVSSEGHVTDLSFLAYVPQLEHVRIRLMYFAIDHSFSTSSFDGRTFAGWGTLVPDFFVRHQQSSNAVGSESLTVHDDNHENQRDEKECSSRLQTVSGQVPQTHCVADNATLRLKSFTFAENDFFDPLWRFLFASGCPVSTQNLTSVCVSHCSFLTVRALEALFLQSPHLRQQMETIRFKSCSVVSNEPPKTCLSAQGLFQRLTEFSRLKVFHFQVFPYAMSFGAVTSFPHGLKHLKIQTFDAQSLKKTGGLAAAVPYFPGTLKTLHFKTGVTHFHDTNQATGSKTDDFLFFPQPQGAATPQELKQLRTVCLKNYSVTDDDLKCLASCAPYLENFKMFNVGGVMTFRAFADFASPGASPYLKTLSLAGTSLNQGWKPFSSIETGSQQSPFQFLGHCAFAGLVTLELNGAMWFQNEDLRLLTACLELRTLRLGTPLLTDDGLVHCFPEQVAAKLRSLDLANCSRLTLRLMQCLTNFFELDELNLNPETFNVTQFPIGPIESSPFHLVASETQAGCFLRI